VAATDVIRSAHGSSYQSLGAIPLRTWSRSAPARPVGITPPAAA